MTISTEACPAPTGAEIRQWVTDRFGDQGPFLIAAKLAEEAGEALGASLKRHQGRTDQDWARCLREEVGDVAIVLLQLLAAEGWTLDDVLSERWEQVVERAEHGDACPLLAACSDCAAGVGPADRFCWACGTEQPPGAGLVHGVLYGTAGRRA